MQDGSRVIAEKRFDNTGEGMKGKGQLLLAQGKFQGVLMGWLEGRKGVEVRLGWRVEGFEQVDGDGVDVRVVREGDGREEVVRARYLVGADGGRSCVRKGMGESFHSLTFWVVCCANDVEQVWTSKAKRWMRSSLLWICIFRSRSMGSTMRISLSIH